MVWHHRVRRSLVLGLILLLLLGCPALLVADALCAGTTTNDLMTLALTRLDTAIQEYTVQHQGTAPSPAEGADWYQAISADVSGFGTLQPTLTHAVDVTTGRLLFTPTATDIGTVGDAVSADRSTYVLVGVGTWGSGLPLPRLRYPSP
jgi:hypothetical protein